MPCLYRRRGRPRSQVCPPLDTIVLNSKIYKRIKINKKEYKRIIRNTKE